MTQELEDAIIEMRKRLRDETMAEGIHAGWILLQDAQGIMEEMLRSSPATSANTTMTNRSSVVAGQNCDGCDEWDAAADEMLRLLKYYFEDTKKGRADIQTFEKIAKSVKQNQNWLKQHDATIRNQTLDAIVEFTKGNSETIEAEDGTLEDAVFLGELLAKLESLRSTEVQPHRSERR